MMWMDMIKWGKLNSMSATSVLIKCTIIAVVRLLERGVMMMDRTLGRKS